MFTTYNSLKTIIANNLDRTDPSTVVDMMPYFIYQAEVKMCEEILTNGVLTTVSSAFITGLDTYQLPARCRRPISMNYGRGDNQNYTTQIELRSYEYCREFAPDNTVLGEPQFYAIYDFYNLVVAKCPDNTYPFELLYMGLPEPLSDINQTNWFTNYASNALLYASVIEALRYLKDYEQIPQWQSDYDKAVLILMNSDSMRKADRGSNRNAD